MVFLISSILDFIVSAFYPIPNILEIAGFVYVVRSCISLVKWLFSKFNILGGKKL